MELQKLGLKYYTDKSRHIIFNKSYLDIYETYFKDIKNNKLNVLEIGVKTGNSIKVWEEYFTNSNIFGLDIDPACKQFESNKTKIVIGSQEEKTSIDELINLVKGKFDIIIDDGSHINEHMIGSFELLFNHLNPGGLYIIEDLANTYYKDIGEIVLKAKWPGMEYNKNCKNFVNDRQTMDIFFSELIHKTDAGETIQYVHFYPWISVIRKN